MKTMNDLRALGKKFLDAREIVPIGNVYRHYLNESSRYKVINLGINEADESVNVIYRDANQNCDEASILWIRKLDVWQEHVLYKGQLVPRFKFVGCENCHNKQKS